MWQAPSKSRGVSGKKRGQRRPLHIKRVEAELRLASAPPVEGHTPPAQPAALARLLLNDISPKGVGVYCTERLNPAQEITITITEPSPIVVRGKVVYCQDAEATSHVLSAVRFSYRVGIQFIFANAEEEAAMKKYCDNLTQVLHPAAA